VYFAKNVACFPFNSWLSFQRLCRIFYRHCYIKHTHTDRVRRRSLTVADFAVGCENEASFTAARIRAVRIAARLLTSTVKLGALVHICPYNAHQPHSSNNHSDNHIYIALIGRNFRSAGGSKLVAVRLKSKLYSKPENWN